MPTAATPNPTVLQPPEPRAERGNTAVRRDLWIGFVLVAVVIVCRFWLADVLPLTDTTEARFAEIARKMVETSDWLVPQHDYGVPYLAKPPLAFWLSAVGIELFGAGELGPRILILGAALAFCGLFFYWTNKLFGLVAAAASLMMLMTSVVFFIAMAAVMTDMLLTVCVCTALIAFWWRYQAGSAGWEAAMYVAIGLGLLAKGPLAAVLVFAPILGWSLATGRYREVWQRFAWIKGALLVGVVAVPWYIAAELRNPGFLQYFLIGEHVGRFIVPGWSGDLYGRAHDAPRGAIWIFWLVGMLPWSLLFIPVLRSGKAVVRRNWVERRDLLWFLFAWALTPLVLFTCSANIIFPYVLPAVPAAVVALVALRAGPPESTFTLLRMSWVGVFVVAAIVVFVMVDRDVVEQHTQRSVIAAVRLRDEQPGIPIYYWRSRYYSADYYSAGATSTIGDPELLAALSEQRAFALVVTDEQLQAFPAAMAARLVRVANVGDFTVLEPEYLIRFSSAVLRRSFP
ncbi:MAG TPA: glycosyltransferase family 39 protein [Gammaproteobacteria bacterium]|nr:glycosyltransferase family 39 protein [Gammaproteobacteria bacterium]